MAAGGGGDIVANNRTEAASSGSNWSQEHDASAGVPEFHFSVDYCLRIRRRLSSIRADCIKLDIILFSSNKSFNSISRISPYNIVHIGALWMPFRDRFHWATKKWGRRSILNFIIILSISIKPSHSILVFSFRRPTVCWIEWIYWIDCRRRICIPPPWWVRWPLLSLYLVHKITCLDSYSQNPFFLSQRHFLANWVPARRSYLNSYLHSYLENLHSVTWFSCKISFKMQDDLWFWTFWAGRNLPGIQTMTIIIISSNMQLSASAATPPVKITNKNGCRRLWLLKLEIWQWGDTHGMMLFRYISESQVNP
jgi:hypothetical protein